MIKKKAASRIRLQIKELEEIQSIYSAWTQKDADILTTPELHKKYIRTACAEL